MKKIILIILTLLVLIGSFASAEEPHAFSETFHEPLDSWINAEIDSEVLLVEMNRLERILERDTESWENLYWRSRAALVRGTIFYEREDSNSSIAELEKSQKFAQESIAIHDNSDSWRIMSEGSSLIMIQKGIGYIIANFSKGQEQAEKSLELDPRNARASLVIAQFLCNAPWIAGGNMKEGIIILKDSSERRDLIDEDEFYILLTLSEVFQKDKQIDEAITACKAALNIFPGNQNGRNLLKDLQSL